MSREFELVFIRANDEDAQFRLRNQLDDDGNPEVQRPCITGYDREGDAARMAVHGHLTTVAHGFEKEGSDVPYTLAIFEWTIVRRRKDKRFRELTIEVSFQAHGERGAAEAQAARRRKNGHKELYWDPEVVAMAPSGTEWYHQTSRTVEDTRGAEFSVTGGFEPFVSAGPKLMWGRSEKVQCGDAIELVGNPAFVGDVSLRSAPNAARWTMLENESQRSGVPSFLRTAVLLKRRPHDDGQFLGHVSLRYKISPFADFRETVLNALAVLPRDDPIIFDPNYPSTPAVAYKNSNLAGAEELLNQEAQVKFQQSLDHGHDGNVLDEGDETPATIGE